MDTNEFSLITDIRA